MLRLWLAEEGEDDLELFGGEEFAFGGVGGGLEGGEKGFVGMDFVGEAFACGFLAVVGEIGHSKVLLELVMHNNEKLNETIGPRAGIRIKERFILCIESPARS
jgi:hypothetical protein